MRRLRRSSSRPVYALLGERVAALAGQLAIGPGLFASLGERDERDAAEPELAPPTADDQALNPAPCSARLDEGNPLPSARLPGGAVRTKAADKALLG